MTSSACSTCARVCVVFGLLLVAATTHAGRIRLQQSEGNPYTIYSGKYNMQFTSSNMGGKYGGRVYLLQEMSLRDINSTMVPEKERCIVCTQWLLATSFLLPDTFDYPTLLNHMSSACTSEWLTKFTYRHPLERPYRFGVGVPLRHSKIIDYSHECKALMDTVGEMAADMIWERWDDLYLWGQMPGSVCSFLGGCPDLPAPGSK